MPGIEFLDEPPPERLGASHRAPTRSRPRVVVAALTLVAATIVGVVVVRNDSPARREAGGASTVTAPPSATPPRTLALSGTAAFGPSAVDVLAVGAKVYALTPTLIGMADRDGGALTIRPAPGDFDGSGSRARIAYDAAFGLLWVADLGATSIGAYDPVNLDSQGIAVAPDPITAAVAMDDRLWFTTARGVYVVAAGARPAPIRLWTDGATSIAADPGEHRVLVSDGGSPSRILAFTERGTQSAADAPFDAVALAVVDGTVWATGFSGDRQIAARLDEHSLQPVDYSAADGRLGTHGSIVATYGRQLLVRGDDGPLLCLDAGDGRIKQSWPVSSGATTLDERGLLVVGPAGLQVFNARDCLA